MQIAVDLDGGKLTGALDETCRHSTTARANLNDGIRWSRIHDGHNLGHHVLVVKKVLAEPLFGLLRHDRGFTPLRA